MNESRIPIGSLIKIISEQTDRTITQATRNTQVTASQVRVLAILKHSGRALTEKELEREMHISQPSVAGLVRRLEEKRYVNTVPSENDGRVRLVCLTPEGTAKCREAYKMAQAIESRMLQGLEAEECQALRRMLLRVYHNLNSNAASGHECEETEKGDGKYAGCCKNSDESDSGI